ncbi:MAG TPA: hypothetical protein VE397_03200, partial [Stellaceae bacterium]|nr:hypothetical protein [Stellaceae bacterium]
MDDMADPDLPGMDETFRVRAKDGAVLPVYCWRGPSGAPALLVAHATALAAGSYVPWLARLARDLAVFAFDARGHGRYSASDGLLQHGRPSVSSISHGGWVGRRFSERRHGMCRICG